MHILRLGGRLATPALALALLAPAAVAQSPQGSITGRVTDVSTKQPLVAARVFITGTALVTSTVTDGKFSFKVAPGTYEVRVALVGYESQKKSVSVAAGQTATVDFELTASPFQLDEIVTTATGEQRKVELGNAVASIKAADIVEAAQPNNLASLLQGRAAGVQILQSSGTTGTGTRIRVRGANSISLSNEPIVYVDGVRVDNSPNTSAFGSALGVGGQGVSRINDINPDDIENIEIVKGPSAATLYGPQAANGVVLITTKKGKAGRTRWNFYSEQGAVKDFHTYPDNVLWTRNNAGPFSGSSNPRCTLADQMTGLCTASAAFKSTDNPLQSEESPYATGWRMQYGANVSGGTDNLNYYISGEWENENGVFEMPLPEQARILRQSGRTALRNDELLPNRLRRTNVRSNITAQLNPVTTIQVNAGYLSSRLRLPINDNSVLGIISSGLTGTGRRVPVTGSEAQFYPNGRPGWGFNQPGETFQQLRLQGIERVTGSASVNTQPLSWLTARANVGVDYTNITERANQRFNEGPNFATLRMGFVDVAPFRLYQYTAEGGLTGTFKLTGNIVSKTSVGAQYLRSLQYYSEAIANDIGFGTNVLRAGARPSSVGEGTSENATWGMYLEEQVTLWDRLFLTGALRRDQNSAYGGQLGAVTLPKASASYLISEESWFPRSDFLSSLRLRAAYGQSSLTPGVTTALAFFNTITAAVPEGGDVAGVTIGNFANPLLKPERSTEYEGGFDLSLFQNRVNVEATYFYKKTKDALIARTLPASIGQPSTLTENIGSIRNKGFEWAVNANILNGRTVSWDVGFSGSIIRNKILSMGGVPPIIFNDPQQRFQEGHTAGSFWEFPIRGWQDGVNVGAQSLNPTWRAACQNVGTPQQPGAGAGIAADGMIRGCELDIDTARVDLGSPFPLNEFAVNTGVTLFNNLFRVQAQLDYRGGFRMANLTQSFRCASSQNCIALYDNAADQADRERTAARFQHPSLTRAGFVEPGWFARLREVSVTFNFPRQWTQAVRMDRLSLTVSGRNLGTWTDYTGVDPEVSGQGQTAQNGFAARDFLTVPPVRYFTARLNVGF